MHLIKDKYRFLDYFGRGPPPPIKKRKESPPPSLPLAKQTTKQQTTYGVWKFHSLRTVCRRFAVYLSPKECLLDLSLLVLHKNVCVYQQLISSVHTRS